MVTTIQDLETAIDALLSHRLGVGGFETTQQIAGKTYEAYVFSLCLRAIRELTNDLTLNGAVSGRLDASTPFVFRGGPGQIHSKMRNYGHARFTLGDDDYEVHANIEFRGRSDMIHELDVCIMRASEAQKCRNPGSLDDPRALSLIGGWECKFYHGTLRKEAGREFVGLMSDMGTKFRISGLCSNADHEQLRKYFMPKNRPDFHFKLTPLEESNEISFIEQVKRELRKLTST